MKGQYKIILVVQELEESAIEPLTEYLFQTVGQIGAKPFIATHEIMNYSAQSDETVCELCGEVVNVYLFETSIDMGNDIRIPFVALVCQGCENKYEVSDALGDMIGEIVQLRLTRWKLNPVVG